MTEQTTPASAIVTARLSAYNMVDPTMVIIDPTWNIRFDKGDIQELANEIKARKQLEPESGGLIVALILERAEEGKLKVVDGERRMTAINLLIEQGETFPNGVPAKILAKGMSKRDKLITMYQAGSAKKFLPLEEAEFFRRMKVDEGLTIEEICELTGKAHMHVTQTLAILDASPELKEALAKGEVGMTLAKEIATVGKGDAALQKDLVADAKAAKAQGSKGKADKKALKKVKAKIEAARQAKAAAKGKTLKPKSIDEEKLSTLGAKMAKHLQVLMKQAGMAEDFELMAWVEKDDKLAAAYTFGVVQALKSVAGLKVKLEV